MNYFFSIKTAIIVFPIIALFFSVPFVLHQYHKYGSISFFRVCIVYSFILYMITIYFLVILPLPKPEDVLLKDNMIRLIPFGFIGDITRELSSVNHPISFIGVLKEPCVYTVLFNILMTIPLGMYLRYYFKCNLKKTICLSFLLSLFFEMTQLTGLYHIYKYPYRVFDVDDLLMNTFGGILGYFVMRAIHPILPTRDEIDQKPFENGKKVSGFRRITLFCFDLVIYCVLSLSLEILASVKHAFLVMFLVYYILFPFFGNGQTIGEKFLHIKVFYKKYGIVKEALRILFLYFYYIGIPFYWLKLSLFLIQIMNLETHAVILFLFFFTCILLLYFIIHFIYLIKNGKIYYDKIFRAEFHSTISCVI